MAEEFLSADAVKDIVKDAVSEAVKAVNTVADEDRPASVKTVSVNKRAYGLPKVGIAMKGAFKGNFKNAEYEKDFSQAAAEVFGYGDLESGRSIVWPKSIDEAITVLEAMGESKHADLVTAAKAMAEGTTSGGGALVPPQYLQEAFAYALVPGIVVRNLPGVTVMPVRTGTTVYLPREDVRAGAASVAEAGSLSNQDVTFAQQSITLKKQYGYRVFSNELLADADPAWGQFITKTLMRDVALYQDAQYLEGAGTGNFITGFAAYGSTTTGPVPGTSAASTNGGTITLDNIMDAIYNLRAVNVEPQQGSGFFIMHPRTLNTLSKIKDTTGNYIVSNFQGYNAPSVFGGQLPGSNGPKAMLAGVPVYLTSQIGITNTVGTSTDCSNVYVGDASKVIVLERQGIELAFSDQVGFATDQSAYRAIGRSAIAVTQPTALEVIKGVRA